MIPRARTGRGDGWPSHRTGCLGPPLHGDFSPRLGLLGEAEGRVDGAWESLCWFPATSLLEAGICIYLPYFLFHIDVIFSIFALQFAILIS